MRKQLAHALYQFDASWRVIARLVEERDQAREQLKLTQEQLRDFKQGLTHQKMPKTTEENISVEPAIAEKTTTEELKSETENCGIYPELANNLTSRWEELYHYRKSRKRPEGYFKSNDLENLTESGSFPLHSSTNPGISCLDIKKDSCNYIWTGGNDGTAVLFDNSSQKVISKLANEKNTNKVLEVEFTLKGLLLSKENGMIEYWIVDYASKQVEFKREIEGHRGVSASAHPLNPYMISAASNKSWAMWNFETGVKIIEAQLDEDHELTAVKMHPDGLILATGWSDGSVTLWDLKLQKKVFNFKESDSPITRLSFSEKAIHLSSVSKYHF